jgi:Ca2+-binding RTX toxin-like protein
VNPAQLRSHPLNSRPTAFALGLLALLACLGGLLGGQAQAGRSDCAAGPSRSGDTARGTPCSDTIVSKPGVRTVFGGGGDDKIYAGSGVTVLAGGGDDTIFASPNGVKVVGGAGSDVITAVLQPQVSADGMAPTTTTGATASCPTGCYLTPGDDVFNGGPGPDIVFGGRSNDTLNGGGGNDLLYGGLGDDVVSGGDGNDLVSGGWGADSVDGQAGDDYARGDTTADTLQDSGGGQDTLSYATGVSPGFPDGSGYPRFSSYRNFPSADGERGVYLSGSVGDSGVPRYGGGVDTVVGGGFETVIGTAFSDYIAGSGADETIYGGGGADVILGNGGNDRIYGGADGDQLDGGKGTNALNGNAGSDLCRSPSSGSSCERTNKHDDGVVLRNPDRISVGMMSPEANGQAQIYLTGSRLADSVTATYNAGPPATVTFSRGSGSAGTFDTSSSASGGCGTPTATTVTCNLANPLDSIVLAGMAGGDTLAASGFPATASVMNLGGEGNDTLSGGDQSEDALVDGPDFTGQGADTLNGLGGDDALVNNGGTDHLLAGNGNDLLLSIISCRGDELNGGGDRDNASWARLTTSVEASLATGQAGAPGAGGPQCASGSLDSLAEIEDLEGSSFADTLSGGSGPNQLLGRAGGDTFRGAEGSDLLLTNAGDLDPLISCGADTDIALIDHPLYGETPDPDCESLQEADPKYAG